MENQNQNQNQISNQAFTASALQKKEEKAKRKGFGGIGIKLLFISIVIIALLIGLACIKGKLNDREDTYKGAKYQISESAGSTLYFQGPYIAVPYTRTIEEFVYRDGKQFTEKKIDKKGWETISAASVNIDAKLDSEARHLGIYSTPIFTGNASVYALFNPKELIEKDGITYNTEEAVLYFELRNSSLLNNPILKMNNADYSSDLFTIDGKNVIGTKFNYTSEKKVVTTNIALRGAEQFIYAISSKQTSMNMSCDWKSPGFTGFSYLPDKHEITDTGFTAKWSVPFGSDKNAQTIGFSFIEPVNLYQKLHRAVEYGFLFIIVPFLVLFLFEIFAKITLHPVHYLLSGAACVLFFLLLLALSEHIPFDAGYLIAAFTAGLTVSLYISSVTKRFGLGGIMMAMFTVLYAYLFFSLKSEDYALLFGAFFAFAVLAALMFLTRKIDWYNLKKKKGDFSPNN